MVQTSERIITLGQVSSTVRSHALCADRRVLRSLPRGLLRHRCPERAPEQTLCSVDRRPGAHFPASCKIWIAAVLLNPRFLFLPAYPPGLTSLPIRVNRRAKKKREKKIRVRCCAAIAGRLRSCGSPHVREAAERRCTSACAGRDAFRPGFACAGLGACLRGYGRGACRARSGCRCTRGKAGSHFGSTGPDRRRVRESLRGAEDPVHCNNTRRQLGWASGRARNAFDKGRRCDERCIDMTTTST